MNKITLYFLEASNTPSLERAVFSSSSLNVTIESQRATGSRDNAGNIFRWTAGVRAISILLLRHGIQRFGFPNDIAHIEGQKGSLAASLDYALAKRTEWLSSIFGLRNDGELYARFLIKRTNPERKRPGPTIISFRESMLPHNAIDVYLNGQALTESFDWERLIVYLENDETNDEEESQAKAAASCLVPGTAPTPNLASEEVLFLSTVSLRHIYFATLFENIEGAIERTFRGKLGCILRSSSIIRDFSGAPVLESLASEYARRKNSIKAVLVVPTWDENFTKAVAQFVKDSRLPLFALTLPFFGTDAFSALGVPVPPLIISDNFSGACQLASAAADELTRQGVHVPVVWILPGDSLRVDSSDRVDGFREESCRRFPHSQIKILPEGKWSRAEAFTSFKNAHLQSKVIPDLIFAANDEMALGIHDYLVQIEHLQPVKRLRPLLCGYDAIDSVRSLISHADKYLFGSVDQNLEILSEAVASSLESYLRNAQTPEPVRKIQPRVIVRAAVPRRAEAVHYFEIESSMEKCKQVS